MAKWSVLITGIGKCVVEAEDIDGAYAVAEAEYGCRLEDVLAVFSHDAFHESKGSKGSKTAVERILCCRESCGFRGGQGFLNVNS